MSPVARLVSVSDGVLAILVRPEQQHQPTNQISQSLPTKSANLRAREQARVRRQHCWPTADRIEVKKKKILNHRSVQHLAALDKRRHFDAM